MKVDWPQIARRLGEGDSARSLAREFGISHTAVLKRAHREGWQRRGANGKPAEPKVPALVTTGTSALALGERTPGNKSMVMADLESGLPVHLAAKCIGMTAKGLENWAKDAPEIQVAAAKGHAKRARLINAAAERGDWKAASWMMERHPETREDFGQRPAAGGGVTVVFNWSRDEPPKQPTVDVTPARQQIAAEVSAAG